MVIMRDVMCCITKQNVHVFKDTEEILIKDALSSLKYSMNLLIHVNRPHVVHIQNASIEMAQQFVRAL